MTSAVHRLRNFCQINLQNICKLVFGLTTAPIITDLLTIERHKAVRQRLHETHDRILFGHRQAEVPDFAAVHVLLRLRRWPACCAFSGVVRLASRQDVARVVEMHDLFQATFPPPPRPPPIPRATGVGRPCTNCILDSELRKRRWMST
jgi:hypothetical protein